MRGVVKKDGQMDALLSLIIILAVLLGVSFLIPYHLARQRTKDYKQGKRKFNALSNNLLQIKEHVSTETDRWPIYARPVLFTEIDHNAQIEFAKAQQALKDADQILPEIETIEELEAPEHFTFNDLLNVPKNLKTIFIGDQLIGSVNALEQAILNLRNSLKSLRTNRQEVEKKRLTVEKSIEELSKRTEQINRRLKPLDVWKSIEAHNLSWVMSIADRCQVEAYNCVANLSENEPGYMEHARADIFVNIGDISLDCIELFLESQKISRRYELDKFKELFNRSTGFLQSILEMDEAWSSWKKLKKVRPYIDALPATRQKAEKSLRSFKNRQQHFERLIALVSGIDVETEIEAVEALEEECIDYWYSYAERKIYWVKALGNPAKFPSKELNRLQTLLVTEINPDTDIDMVIKQSQLLGLIMKIGTALELHNTIAALTIQLETELKVHKEAQKIVNRLLDDQGEATLILGEVQLALVDTSPDIADWGTIMINDYKSYFERAKRVQGADFPELLNSLDYFIIDSGKLVNDHNSQLQELKAAYDAFYDHIDLLNNELERYINHIPKFEKDAIGMFNDFFEESRLILDEQEIEEYSWLRPAVNKMQAWSEKTENLIAPARNKYDAFETEKGRVEELLRQTKEAINIDRTDTAQTWGWGKNEILPRIKAAAQSFDRKKRNWDRLIETNWAGYNITRARSECVNLIEFCEGKIFELTQAIEKVGHKQNRLDDKVKDIVRLVENNGYKLPPHDQHEINSLIQIAEQAANYDYADRLLNYAYSLAIRRVNPQVRREIQKIIIDSGGGPIFMAGVTNRGNIGGALRITQHTKQKRGKRNDKKR